MSKRIETLRREMAELLESIGKTTSSFEAAELSQKLSEAVEKWKKIEEEYKDTGIEKPEPKPEPKDVDVEIQLLGEIIITHPDFGYNRLRIKKENMPHNAIVMTQHLLESITGVVYKFDGKERLISHPVGLRNYLIQILEEKFGLKIKICGNCGYYWRCFCCEKGGVLEDKFCDCPEWRSWKEISEEKKEEEKTCGNCGHFYCWQGNRCERLGGISHTNERTPNSLCYFTPSEWIPKETSEEKK